MLDKIIASEAHWWLFFAVTILFFLLVVEGGYWYGRWRGERVDGEQKNQTGTILAALLALLGFLLAISFGIAADRFSQRKQLVLQEANDIGTTFLRTDFLPVSHRQQAKTLLADYIEVRIKPLERGRHATMGDLQQALERSQQIQTQLWSIANAAANAHPRSVPVGLFVDSLNSLIDVHEERVTVGAHFRVPPSLLWTLYLVATLSMLVMGIHFGLSGTRNLLASLALIVAFAMVLLLIVDLDQVRQHLFSVDQSAMIDTQKSIQASMNAATPPTPDAPHPSKAAP